MQSPNNFKIISSLPNFLKGQRHPLQNFLLGQSMGRSNLKHVVCWNSPPELYLASRRRKFVFYDHGFSSLHEVTTKRKRQLSAMKGIICVSSSNKKLLEDLWQYDGSISVVRNPLRQTIARRRMAKKELPKDKIRISCAARLVSFKGIASVIHASSELFRSGYPVELSIAGVGPETQALKEAANKLLPQERVKFCGLVEDMGSFFDETDIFVAPSLREPFGLSPLEAIASGVPTLLSNVDGHPEVLPFDGAATLIEPELSLSEYARLGSTNHKMPKFVYFPSKDLISQPRAIAPDTLAEALKQTIERYPEQAEKAAAAGNLVRQEYTIKKYTDDILSNYERLF